MKKKLSFLMAALLITEIIFGVALEGILGGANVHAATSAQVLPVNAASLTSQPLVTSMGSNVTVSFSTYGQPVDLLGQNSFKFKLNFSDSVAKESGTIKITKNGVSRYQVNIQDSVVQLSQDGREAVVTVSDTNAINVMKTEEGSQYDVWLDRGAFKDSSGNLVESMNWSFLTKSQAIVSSPLSPSNNGVNVPIDTTIQMSFDRAMMVGSGSIVVSPGTVNDSRALVIPVNQASVSNSSSGSTISISLPSMLMYDTAYTITVPTGAFKDSYNNLSPMINDWGFKTIAATASSGSLIVSKLSPTKGATVTAVASDLVITFNKDVAFRNGIYNDKIVLKQVGGSIIRISTPTINGNEVRFRPISTLGADTRYYVEIAADTLVDKVNPNITFPGFSGSSIWYFNTVLADKTIPVLQTVQMYTNNTIRLAYSETLDVSNNPHSSNFTVLVNSENRRVNSSYIIGDSVYVVLEVGVAVSQNVQISYNASLGNPIQDPSMNRAASFTNKTVANNMDTVLPKPKEGSVYGTTLSLMFNESLKSPSSNAYDQFTVTVNGSSVGVRSISQSGSMLYFTLDSSIPDGDVVRISYRVGSYPIQDYRGQNITEFTDFYVRNTYDTKPPVFMGAEGLGNKIYMKYNEPLKNTNIPMKNQISVLVNNLPVYVTGIQIMEDNVQLTLSSSITTSQNVSISYVPGIGSARITDLNGNSATHLNLEPVSVTFGTLVREVRSAIVKGDTLTIQFTNSLTSSLSTNELNSLFSVRVDNLARSIQSSSLSGSTLTLHLSSQVLIGQRVQVSFSSGYNTIKDNLGNVIPSFSNLDVQNLTTNTNTKPANLGTINASEFGTMMYVLNSSDATTRNITSKYSQSTKRYMIDSAKLKIAFDYMMTTASKTIAFEVPSSERAAYVGIPLQAIQEALSKNQQAQFAVKLGDSIYSVPLASFKVNNIMRDLNSTNSTSMIWIQIEKVPTSAVSDIMKQISQAGATMVVDTTEFYVSAENTTSGKSIPLKVSSEYLLRTTKAVNAVTTSLVYFDKSTAQISFVPTKVEKLTNSTILHAFVKENYIVTGVTNSKSYGDVVEPWAKEAINELVAKFIVSGRSQVTFEPSKNITRGEFAVFVAKALGLSGDSEAAARFRDVKLTSTTGSYIGAATKAGIIHGFTDGMFKPDSFITREQMAIMMVRAMDYAGYKTTNTSTPTVTLSKFSDRGKIQSLESVSRAVNAGIIQGVSTTKFVPQGYATRAQATVMLKRLLTAVGYL